MLKKIPLSAPDLKHHPLIQILLVMAVFFLAETISLFSFYNGFLTNFEKICGTVFTSGIFEGCPYHSFSILFAALLHPLFLLSLSLFYLPFFLKRKEKPWNHPPFEKTDRLVVLVCSLALSWELTTYDYNYYLDHAFYLDRIILLALPFIIYRYPVFIPVFIAFAYVYRSQFNYPVDGFMLIDKRVLWDIPTLSMVLWYIRLYISSFKWPFLFFVICLVAGNYFYSGLAKILIAPHGYEWLAYNQPADLFYNVHLRGWLAGASETTITGMAEFIGTYGNIFQWIVFLLECAALFLLFSRKTTLWLLALLFFMHIGIFIFGSMLFWKWMVVDVTLFFLLLRMKPEWTEQLFSKKNFRFSLLLIIPALLWMRPAKIAWADTPYTVYYSYEVVDENGNVCEMAKNQFNPYHQWIQYDRFAFLVNEKLLPVSGFGYTANVSLAEEIRRAGSSRIVQLEKEMGNNYFDARLKDKYVQFIKSYFKTRNQRLDDWFIPGWFRAPYHIYNKSVGRQWDEKTPVKKFRVILNRAYTEKGVTTLLTKKVVTEITIPS